MAHWANRLALKTAVLVFAVLSVTGLTYRVIGLINARYRNWASVFYCYAGNARFIDSYAPPGSVALMRWRPTPIGVLRQGGQWGLVLASPLTEAEFLDPTQAANFRKLQKRLNRIAALMRVEVINMAGILPGHLARRGAVKVNNTRDVVASAVCTAVTDLHTAKLPDTAREVIVLGGAGHVGRRVCAVLEAAGYRCHVVDTRSGPCHLPPGLNGRPCLLVDIARRGAIAHYIPQMWPGLIVLNEVFPCPSRRDVARMTAAGVQVFHLAGVAGRIIPPLPHGYEHAVPCCAAHGACTGKVRIIPLGARHPA